MSQHKMLSDLLATISGGDFNINATAELDKVVAAVEAGHGTGKLTLTFAIKKDERKLVIKPSSKATVPTAAASSAMFFVGSDGKLTDEDPKQRVIQFPASKPGKLVEIGGKKPTPEADGSKDNDDTKKGN